MVITLTFISTVERYWILGKENLYFFKNLFGKYEIKIS